MDSNTPLTANQLAARQRAEAPNGRATIGPRRIREAIRKGQLGARIGSRYVATPAELQTWLELQRVTPPLDNAEQRQRARDAALARVRARTSARV